MNHDAQALNRQHFEIKILNALWHSLCSKHHSIWQEMSLRMWDICAFCEYGNETTLGVHCAYFSLQEQFSLKLVYVRYSSAFLLKCCTTSLDTVHTYLIFSDLLFCCIPSSNFFEWLAEGQVSGNIVVKWKHTPRCSHRICSCTQIVGEHLFITCKLEKSAHGSRDYWS